MGGVVGAWGVLGDEKSEIHLLVMDGFAKRQENHENAPSSLDKDDPIRSNK